MKKVCVTIHVNPSAAVRAGRAFVGECLLSLSDGDLESLTEEQRDTLARHLARDRYFGELLTMFAEPVGEASVETLRLLLDQRRAWASKKQAEADAERAKAAEHVARAIEIAKSCDVKDLCHLHGRSLVAFDIFMNDRLKSCVSLREHPAYGKSAAEMAGRRGEAEAFLAAEHEKYLAACRAASEREEAEREAKRLAFKQAKETERAVVRAFIEQSSDDPDVTAWFDVIDDVQEAKAVVLSIMAQRLDAAGLVTYEKRPDERVGSSPVLTLDSFKAAKAARQIANEALDVPGVDVMVEPVSLYRPATENDPPNTVDDDDEVEMRGWVRVGATFGETLRVSLYVHQDHLL